jgi:5'(3')-deoxyribonucleotidase
MRIAIDIDCTLTTCIYSILNYINTRLPVDLKLEDIKSYYIEEALPEQYRWIVAAAFRDPEMWRTVKFLPHAAEVVEQLIRDGHEVWFATSAEPKNMHKKVKHLSRNMQNLDYEYIWKHTINIQDKYLLNVDILIDDFLGHLTAKDRRYYSIAINYPWNQITANIPCFTRVNDWTEVRDKVRMIEGLIVEDESEKCNAVTIGCSFCGKPLNLKRGYRIITLKGLNHGVCAECYKKKRRIL